jgi:hypothetical protein
LPSFTSGTKSATGAPFGVGFETGTGGSKMKTIHDLDFRNGIALLLQYRNGERALWVSDEMLAGNSDTPCWTLNDINEKAPIAEDEDVDVALELWKAAVEWEEDEA